MQIVTNEVHENKFLQLSNFFNTDDVVVFDIETTGFTAETSTLYLIGCGFYHEGKWMISQWFNDDGESECDIIVCFMEFLQHYKQLLHYNGDGFDIPFLQKKIAQYKLPYTFDHIESIDIYKQLRPMKEIFHVENLKQKTLEHYLGIKRLDKYTGGDLIKVYQDYLKKNTETGRQHLIQHNYEDLEGLMYCCSLLAYPRLKAGCLQVRKMSVRQNRLLFSLELSYNLPKRISLGIHDILITAYGSEATINVPIIQDEFKFFFDNYREYYYLPAEDMAVHKSVATYVDKNYRQQAKKENCYLRRYGYFISQIDEGILTGYKRNYKDKETFIELADSFLQDLALLNSYARYIVYKAFTSVK